MLLAAPTVSADSYLCVGDKSTGFKLEKGELESILYGGAEIVVIETGEKIPVAGCGDGFGEMGKLECSGLILFRMNKYSLKYTATSAFAYWMFDKETPFIEIGKCSIL